LPIESAISQELGVPAVGYLESSGTTMQPERNLWDRLLKPQIKRRVLIPSLSVLALASLWACGGSSPSRPVSIVFAKAPPSSLSAGGQTTISTTVINDSGTKGADWTLACGSSSCGSLSPAHTASGSPTSFTAPAFIPVGNAVTITATASADATQTVSATVLITGATISIALTQPPPASLNADTQAMVGATVSNDPSNAGVDWAVTCGSSICGSFSPAHTASGAATTYTAPTGIHSVVTVTITATAGADTSKAVSAMVTVTPGAIFFTQAPPASLATSAQSMISATVLQDPASLGVDWTVRCGSSDCGSFSPAHTASGAATTYTAPATVPTGNTVIITARATAKPSATVTATVTVTTSAVSLLNGLYAFMFTGNDVNGFFAVAGSISADGKGNITSGEEDFADTSLVSTGVTLTGTFSIGSDGRGTITLQLSDKTIGVNGVQSIRCAVITSQHALLSEFDGSATSNGTLDLQNPVNFATSSIAGGYSFSFSGLDVNGSPEDAGGVFTADGAGNVSGGEDINDFGVVHNGPLSGTYSSPDAFGRGTATLGTGSFTYYIVDSGHLKFVETDLVVSLFAGSAVAQGSGPFSSASLSGNFVFTVTGAGTVGGLAAGGLLTADGSGTITSGSVDVNNFGVVTIGTFTGTYSIAANGRGVLTLSGNTGGLVQFALYLTASHGVLLLELDTASFSIGTVLSQSGGISAASLNGKYAMTFDAASIAAFTQEDLVGQILADGVSAFTGGADINQFTVPTTPPPISNLFPGTPLTGTFSANPDGRFTGTIASSVTGTLSLIYYVASGSHILFVGLDSNSVTSGALEMQQF
jgi:hypothetical protein